MSQVFLAILILLSLPCPPLHAKTLPVQTLHFSEEANWPPFTPNHFGLATEGLSLALMQAIFSRLGVAVEIELLPMERVLYSVKTGQSDGVTVISKNAERLEYLDFSEPLFAKRGYLYCRADRKPPLAWRDYAELQGLRIGIVAGHNYGDEFAAAASRFALKLVSVSQERQLFAMLMADRLDCFLCIDLTANHYLRDPAWAGRIIHAAKSYYDQDYHIGFAKKSAASRLLPSVNVVINQMRKDGAMDRLLSSYRFE